MGIVIGTRGSALALAQARQVQGWLGGEAAGVRLEIIKTRGDLLVDVDLRSTMGKGFFTSELEEALRDGRVDLAVHSLKDLPTEGPAELAIPGIPIREEVHDVLLARPEAMEGGRLRPGARVGTSANRRQALVRAELGAGPVLFRGNVPTRVQKLREGVVDAIVLAAAGLNRLGLDLDGLHRIDLDPVSWTPAPAQGALGLQCRADDQAVHAALAAIAKPELSAAVAVERLLLGLSGGGCHAAFGAWARVVDGRLVVELGRAGEAGWERARLEGAMDASPEDWKDAWARCDWR